MTSRQYDILLTTYSELAHDELGYIHKILDFYDIPRTLFCCPKIEKTISGSHFRVGLEDEWMTELTSDQVLRATAMIGDDLLTRFAWPLALELRQKLSHASQNRGLVRCTAGPQLEQPAS